MPYAEQLQYKQNLSTEILDHVRKQFAAGGVPLPECMKQVTIDPIVGSPVTTAYRNKCEFAIGRNGDEGGEVCVGFVTGRRPDGSSCVLSPDACSHIPDCTKNVVKKFQALVAASDLPVLHDAFSSSASSSVPAAVGFWRMLTVKCFLADLLLIVTVTDGLDPTRFDQLKRELVEFFDANAGVAAETPAKAEADSTDGVGSGRVRLTSLYVHAINSTSDTGTLHHIAGAPYCYELLLNKRFRVSPMAFFQTNTAAAECLYTCVGRLAGVTRESVLLDICCGTGTIGISLADRCRAVLGVELVESAVADARENARLNGVSDRVQFMCGQAEQCFGDLKYLLPAVDHKFIQANKELDALPDLIGVVDPPRAGLHNRLIQAIRRLSNLRRLVFVSCDPRAAAANFVSLMKPTSNRFPGAPFRLNRVLPVDMFPQTRHVEWVCLFER